MATDTRNGSVAVIEQSSSGRGQEGGISVDRVMVEKSEEEVNHRLIARQQQRNLTGPGEIVEEGNASNESCNEQDELSMVVGTNAIPYPWAMAGRVIEHYYDGICRVDNDLLVASSDTLVAYPTMLRT